MTRAPAVNRPSMAKAVAPFLVGATALAAWELACRTSGVPVYLVPAPTDIAHTLATQAPLLALALLTTLKVTLLAFGLATGLGIAFAALVVQSTALEASLMPYAVLLQVTPVVAVAPLIIIWVKDTTWALVLCATMVAIFPIISNTVVGLRSAPAGLRNLFLLHRASRWQTLLRLRIPAALPFVLAGLRVSSGLALIGAVVAEFVAGTGGTGAGLAYQILMAGQQLDIPLMFAALLLIAVTGILLYLAMGLLSRLALGKGYDGG